MGGCEQRVNSPQKTGKCNQRKRLKGGGKAKRSNLSGKEGGNTVVTLLSAVGGEVESKVD